MNKGSKRIDNGEINWASLLEESIDNQPRHRPYASKAGYCPSANWYMGNTQGNYIVSGSMKLYQGIGVGVESEIVNAAKRNNILVGTQVKLPTVPSLDVDIGGFIDMIVKENNKLVLYEIKTCTALPRKIKPEHAAQAAAYWLFSGIEDVRVLYVSRKVQDFPDPTPLLCTIKFDPEQHENQLLNVCVTLQTFNSHKPPTRPQYFSKSRDCTFCNFSQKCWSSTDKDFLSNSEMEVVRVKASKLLSAIISKREVLREQTIKNCKEATNVGK